MNLVPNTYGLTVTDNNGCIKSGSVLLPSLQAVFVDIGADQQVLAGDTAFLSVNTNALPPYNVEWSPSDFLDDPTSETPIAIPFETTTYTVTVTSREGCVGTDEMTITVIPRGIFAIPSGFTPNGDGNNDLFYVHAQEAQIEEIRNFQIINRWGDLIYEAKHFQPNDPSYGWDGTFNNQLLTTQVFAYFVEIAFINGEVEVFKGDVTLLK